MTAATIIIQAPELDVDKLMLELYEVKVRPTGRLERRIVANLIAHLQRAGFEPVGVHDGGDECIACTDMKDAMEHIFAVDEAYLYVKARNWTHWIRLVLGNGLDVICDYSYARSDHDGFNAAMEAFDVEQYA